MISRAHSLFGKTRALMRPATLGLFALIGLSTSALADEIVTGTLTATTTDSFTRTFNAGDQVIITLDSTTGTFQPEISVTGPDIGTPDVIDLVENDTDVFSSRIVTTGTYTIEIADRFDNDGGPWRVDITQTGSTPDGGTIVDDDAVLTGSLIEGEVRSFQFDGTGKDHLVVSFTSPLLLEPKIEVFNPDGSRLFAVMRGTNDPAPNNLAIGESIALPTDGVYTLVIAEDTYNTPGDYQIDFSLLPGADDGGILSPGDLVNDSLSFGEVIAYQVPVSSVGENIVATLYSSDFAPLLELFGPDGVRVATDSSPAGSTSPVSFTTTQIGNYTLVVSDRDYQDAGNFRLDVAKVPGANDGGILADGIPVTGTFALGEVRAYQFDANAGETVLLALNSTTLDTFLAVYDPSGTEVFSGSSGLGGTAYAQASPGSADKLTIASSGTHTVLISENGYDQTGNFRLEFIKPSNGGGTSLVNGARVTETIVRGQVLAYEVIVQNGETLSATLNSSSFSPWLELYDSTGTLVVRETRSPTNILNQSLTTGTYTLLASDARYNEAGTLSLDVSLIPGANDGGLLDNSTPVAEAIAAGEMRAYQFGGSNGDSLVATLTSSDFTPLLELYSPTGAQLGPTAINPGSSQISRSLTETGTYTLIASSSFYEAAGNMSIEITGTNAVDTDSDGLSDLEEAVLGTDPNVADTDVDTILDGADNCPLTVNTDQLNTDGDTAGNACDADDDNDTIDDGVDNCPLDANTDQLNTDGDMAGNVCDADDDGDGLTDVEEALLGTDPLLVDSDSDGADDNVDNCPVISNADQLDTDSDMAGNVCDSDDDNDTVDDGADNCPLDANTDQLDTDSDMAGNVCDTDDDGDGLTDVEEALLGTDPLLVDSDSDGADDNVDNCPVISNADQLDTDSDMAGNVCDSDDDGDGLSDSDEANLGTNPLVQDSDSDTRADGVDNCPLISNNDQLDTDADGRGDVCDSDDDNDGLTDSEETTLGTDPLVADSDGDGFDDGSEVDSDTNPLDGNDVPPALNPILLWLPTILEEEV